jgi:hypothetical protein
MKYEAFSDHSLTMMYEGVRGAMAADDTLIDLKEEPKFRIRETAGWKEHAGQLEMEMLKRGMFVDIIDWLEDQRCYRLTKSNGRRSREALRHPFWVA